MSAAPREQTVLRVKRRRSENPPSTIRLELLGGWNVHRQDENADNILRSTSTATLADSRHSNMSTTSTQTTSNVAPRRATAAAVWKRVEELPGDVGEKRCRVVEAIFESDGPSTKRRKLTVLGESKNTDDATKNNCTTPKKKNIYKVLDPTTRLVDDSLTMVHAGDRSVADHYRFLTTDPRLAINARAWLVHRNRGGNLLHACAHWNDVELAHDLLRQSLSGLAEAVDDDGRTPYETAELCGHDSIVGVLEAFGADTTNFVYDMFVPEEIELEIPTIPTAPQAAEEAWNPLEKTAINSKAPVKNGILDKQPAAPDMSRVDTSRLLELQGGVGYWTEDGDLILEVEAHHMIGITNEFGHESDEEYGEDIDSNCEDYGGNDYPDEESWEEEFLHEEPQIEDDPYDHGPTADEYDMW